MDKKKSGKKAVTEHQYQINLRELKRKGLLQPGQTGICMGQQGCSSRPSQLVVPSIGSPDRTASQRPGAFARGYRPGDLARSGRGGTQPSRRENPR